MGERLKLSRRKYCLPYRHIRKSMRLTTGELRASVPLSPVVFLAFTEQAQATRSAPFNLIIGSFDASNADSGAGRNWTHHHDVLVAKSTATVHESHSCRLHPTRDGRVSKLVAISRICFGLWPETGRDFARLTSSVVGDAVIRFSGWLPCVAVVTAPDPGRGRRRGSPTGGRIPVPISVGRRRRRHVLHGAICESRRCGRHHHWRGHHHHHRHIDNGCRD